MRPALDALASACRVITYSLCGDFGPIARDASHGFDAYVGQVDATCIDRARACERRRSAACRSAGSVAATFAAPRPDRTSVPRSSSRPRRRRGRRRGAGALPRAGRGCRRRSFLATAPGRMWPEIAAATDGLPSRLRFCAAHRARCAYLAAPHRAGADGGAAEAETGSDLARRLRSVSRRRRSWSPESRRSIAWCRRRRRASIVTTLIGGARYTMMAGTGHLGLAHAAGALCPNRR